MEAYLNRLPLVALPADDDGMEALTLGHFLVGRPVEALLDPSSLYHSLHLLMRCYLCQALMRHFWQHGRESTCIVFNATLNVTSNPETWVSVILSFYGRTV